MQIDRFIIILAVLWVIIVIFFLWLQRKTLFYPNDEDSGYRPYKYQEFYLDENGKDTRKLMSNTIYGWYIKNGKTTVLFCHGNAGNITHRDYIIEICNYLNLSLVLFDYSGFGMSPGTPSLIDIMKQGERVYQYITSFVQPDDLIIWGESMGGSVAVHLASNFPCKKLMLLSTFSSIDDILINHESNKYKILGLVLSYFSNTVRSKDRIKHIKCPILIVHSIEDEVIPYSCALELYSNIKHKDKILITIRGKHSEPIIEYEHFTKIMDFMDIHKKTDEKDIKKLLNNVTTAAKRNRII